MADSCIKCKKEVRKRQEAILRDKCEKWCHRTCGTGIDRSVYRRMVKGEVTVDWTPSLNSTSQSLLRTLLCHHLKSQSLMRTPIWHPLRAPVFHLVSMTLQDRCFLMSAISVKPLQEFNLRHQPAQTVTAPKRSN